MRPRPTAVPRASRRAPARGATLPLFCVLVFALLAAATVAVDLGLARLAQAQMQGAVDSAALEGQRWRQDNTEFEFFSDAKRRRKAAEMVALVFDDDLDPSNGDRLAFGAGPLLDLTGGTAAGARLLQVPEPAVYDPVLEPNANDLIGGDVVSGSFDIDAPGGEGPGYARDDFTPATDAEGHRLGDGFLVRLRRSGSEALGILPGGTSGPGLPCLFGFGAPIRAGDGASFDPRRDGWTVRATTIAHARPALSVGRAPVDADGDPIPNDPAGAYSTEDHGGVAAFAVSLSFWTRYTLNDPACVVIDSVDDGQDGGQGRIRLYDADLGQPVEVIGWFVTDMLQVGHELQRAPLPSAPCDFPDNLEGFIPVYTDIAGTPRVIGFGRGFLRSPIPGDPCSDDVCADGDVRRTFSKRKTYMPLTGASALPLYPLDPLDDDEWSQVFNLNRIHFTTDQLGASIVAPALAR